MSATVNTEGKGAFTVAITGSATTDNAGLGAIINPEGVTCIITRTTLYVATQSTGAANLGIGVTTASAKATDIFNDGAVGGATGKAYNGHAMQNTAKTEITAPALWTADKYITITGSASTVGLAATLYVEYVRV
jgi:hypothetical protein